MDDDRVNNFVNRFRSKVDPGPASAPAPQPTLPPSLTHHEADGREAYEAMEHQVRAMNVEIRCHRDKVSYSICYIHMSGILSDLRTDGKLRFTGGGFGVTIYGRNLREILRAMNLHACSLIQEFSPDLHILPKPVKENSAFVERIDVVVLRPLKSSDDAPPQADKT